MLYVSFYKFFEIKEKDLKIKKKEILNLMKNFNIKGKILISKEGINGMFDGEEKNTEIFEKDLNKILNQEFWFKRREVSKNYFKRSLVKIRDEIITFKYKYDIKNTGKYIKPKELKSWYENKKDFVIVDHRNDYEFEEGHFENSINLNIKEFSEFVNAISKIKNKIKNKKIVNFCTGGVRCEKSTAWMVENGFGDSIYQIDGGIINYGDECGDKFWKGKCFVFDERGAIELDKKKQKENYNQCNVCFVPCENKHICKKTKKKFIQCSKCYELMEGFSNKMLRNENRIKEKRKSQIKN